MDFIPQHHGTQLVEFFYDKACKQQEENKHDEKDFRYPGPKPQSVEVGAEVEGEPVSDKGE